MTTENICAIKAMNKRLGFSFIEILIVLAIVAGIATLVLRQSDSAIDSSIVRKFQVDIDELRTAAAQYKVQTGSYKGIHMFALAEAGLLPDRFLADPDDGDPRVDIGMRTSSRSSSPIGQDWSLLEFDGGQAFVIKTSLDVDGVDPADLIQLGTRLSRYSGGPANNCGPTTRNTNYVVVECLGYGQPWTASMLGASWGYKFD